MSPVALEVVEFRISTGRHSVTGCVSKNDIFAAYVMEDSRIALAASSTKKMKCRGYMCIPKIQNLGSFNI